MVTESGGKSILEDDDKIVSATPTVNASVADDKDDDARTDDMTGKCPSLLSHHAVALPSPMMMMSILTSLSSLLPALSIHIRTTFFFPFLHYTYTRCSI